MLILHEMPIMHLLLSVGLYEAHAFVYWFVFIHPFIYPSIYQSTINLSINLSLQDVSIDQSTIIYRYIYPNLSTVINSCLQSWQLQGSSKSQAHPPQPGQGDSVHTLLSQEPEFVESDHIVLNMLAASHPQHAPR